MFSSSSRVKLIVFEKQKNRKYITNPEESSTVAAMSGAITLIIKILLRSFLFRDSLHIFCSCQPVSCVKFGKRDGRKGDLLNDERLLINHNWLTLSLALSPSLCMSYCLIMETHSVQCCSGLFMQPVNPSLSFCLSPSVSFSLFYSFRLTPDSSSHCSFSPPFILPSNGQSTHLNLHFSFLPSCPCPLSRSLSRSPSPATPPPPPPPRPSVRPSIDSVLAELNHGREGLSDYFSNLSFSSIHSSFSHSTAPVNKKALLGRQLWNLRAFISEKIL